MGSAILTAFTFALISGILSCNGSSPIAAIARIFAVIFGVVTIILILMAALGL